MFTARYVLHSTFCTHSVFMCLQLHKIGHMYVKHFNFKIGVLNHFCTYVRLALSIKLALHVSFFTGCTWSWGRILALVFYRSSPCELSDFVANIVRTGHQSISYSSMLTSVARSPLLATPIQPSRSDEGPVGDMFRQCVVSQVMLSTRCLGKLHHTERVQICW